jgi:acyl carrier protein
MEQTLLGVFRDVFPSSAEPEKLSRGSGEWDSIKHIELVTAIEEQYGVEIPMELTIQSQNFSDFLFYLNSLNAP